MVVAVVMAFLSSSFSTAMVVVECPMNPVLTSIEAKALGVA